MMVVDVQSLGLKIRPVRSATDVAAVWSAIHRALIPTNAQPFEILEEANARCIARSLLIRIFNADDKLPAAPLREGPAKQGSSCASHVQVT